MKSNHSFYFRLSAEFEQNKSLFLSIFISVLLWLPNNLLQEVHQGLRV